MSAALPVAALLMLAPAVAAGPGGVIPSAAAAPCPDIEVIFARGLDEPVGAGLVGDALVSALQTRTGREVASYGVNYPAQLDTVAQGVTDMTGRIASMAANCPNTRLVVGGYSLGGAVTNAVLNNSLPPGVDQHIAAVVTFGNASRLVNVATDVPPLYTDRTLELCNPGDPICSGGPFAPSHLQVAYIAGGPVGTAADFAAGKL